MGYKYIGVPKPRGLRIYRMTNEHGRKLWSAWCISTRWFSLYIWR